MRALRALHVSGTAIVDMQRVAHALAGVLRDKGVEIQLDRRVDAIARGAGGVTLATSGGIVRARVAVACAGLGSDRVAAMTGDIDDTRIVPFRGDYAVLRPHARGLVRHLIYPVADPALPFLGVHATRRIDADVWLRPNAVLAFARERYRRAAFDRNDARDVVRFPGAWRAAQRWWRVGVPEQWRDVSKRAFVTACRRSLPELSPADVRWGAGRRSRPAHPRDGTLLDDFVLQQTDRILHVRNAPSPAATASLAIGSEVAQRSRDAGPLTRRVPTPRGRAPTLRTRRQEASSPTCSTSQGRRHRRPR